MKKSRRTHSIKLFIASSALMLALGVSLLARIPTSALAAANGALPARDSGPTLAFSQDGETVASVGEDGQITLLNLASGEERTIVPDASSGTAAELAFSPDGKALAGAAGGAITLWEVASAEERARFFSPKDAAVKGLAFAPDGRSLAGIANDSEVVVWDLQSGAQRWAVSKGTGQVTGIVFSADGALLASHGNDARISVMEVASGRERFAVTDPSGAVVNEVLFSPTGGTLAAGSDDGTIALWDAESGDVRQDVPGHQGPITRLAFSPDGTSLASGGNDAQIKLWDVESGRELMALPGHFGGPVTGLRFSPDGVGLASVGGDSWIVLWDAQTGELGQVLGGDTDAVAEFAFSRNQPTLASVGKDGQVAVWDLDTGAQQFTAQIPVVGGGGLDQPNAAFDQTTQDNGNQPPVPAVSALATDESTTPRSDQPAGAVRAAAREDSKLRKASPRNWKGVRALALSPDGNLLGSAGEDGAVRVWDAAGGAERFAVRGHLGAPVTGVAFLDGQRLVSVGGDSVVRLWDGTNGNAIASLTGHEQRVRAVAASPDGQRLASAGESTRIMVWDPNARKLIAIFNGHGDFINGLAFSPDGQLLASASADGLVKLWDVAAGAERQSLEGHSAEVNAVAFSPDGARLASGASNGKVIVWDVNSGQPTTTLEGHQAGVRSVAFSRNGRILVSAGEDNRILVRDPVSGDLLRELPGNRGRVNALLFGPQDQLITADEDSDITEWNVETGARKEPRRPSRQIQSEPVSSLGNPFLALTTAGSLARFSSRQIASAESGRSEPVPVSPPFGWLLDLLLPAASAQSLPDPNQGPGGPILVIDSSSSLYGKYYAEILRNEGLNAFSVANIGTVNSGMLADYDVVILAEMGLSGAQVTMLSDWVTAGGNLITMRPDPQLAGLLGITSAGTTLSNGYLLIDTSVAPGKGLVSETIQFHGTADRYTLNGASEVATLYSAANSATSNPAVTLRSVLDANNIDNGGQAAAFAFDLATSVVYTRQGNPAWAAEERDGFSPIRSDDKFYGDAAGDPQPDWVDLNKVGIPQADEQQRLLANLIIEMNRDKKPLPRFWYFPRGEKAVVIMTGDNHANNGTEGRFEQFLAASPPGCSVADWECVRGTSYMYPNTPLTDAQAASYAAQGFEVGLHVNTGCADFTFPQLDNFYSTQIAEFAVNFPGIPAPSTQRHHCIAWSDWVTGAQVQLQYGIRLDTSYYFWPPSWVLNRPGFFNGSAMPMRFADLDGTLIDVYNAQTQMTDESGQSYPFTINTLLDWALGAEGYYGAFTINAHTDVAQIPESDAVVASAQSRGVPIVTSKQMLEWLDGRNSSSFDALAWNGSELNFTVTAGTGANGLQALVPFIASGGALTGITGPGGVVSFTPESIKGIEYAVFPATAGAYVVAYAADTGAPTVTSTLPADGAADVDPTAAVTATFSEAMDSATITTSTFELRLGDAQGTLVPAEVTYGATNTATLTATLDASATYTATITTGVTDLLGNPLAEDFTWSFTTGTAPPAPCAQQPCTIWDASATPGTASVNDPNAVELGVKFRSDIDGFISGIRFYKGTGNTGPHVGNLWDSSETQLATATFTNETASGWQQVDFSTPVAVTANTVYVASYHTETGNYAADNSYFAAGGVDRPPLHALQDGVSGGNGVYLYGPGGFPSNTFGSTNYWVDVVFTTTGGTPGPDTTPPTVTMSAPAEGATVTGAAVTVSADAIDDVGVASVQFLLDGAALGPPATSEPYSITWDSTAVADGAHTLSAQASDGAGNTAIATAVNVTVSNGGGGDTTPPTVTMSAPAEGATVTGAAVTVSADAIDDVGVASVQFLLDGAALGPPATSEPYSITWDSTAVADGAHTLSAQASDAAGNTAIATAVNVTVSNGVTTTSIWPPAAIPALLADPDTSAVELGVKFQSDVDGFITGIRFYKSETNTGTHVGSLWASTGGTPLAQVTFSNETASGWQQVNFATPVAITANTVYVASYHTDVGQYSIDNGYFTSAYTNGPLRAPADGESGGNGVYLYGPGGFPTDTFGSSNYWVDVVFTTSTAPDTTPPTVTSVTPADGAVDVALGSAITATFSEAMDEASVVANFVLLDGGGTAVPATVGYDGSSNVATLTPTDPLIPSVTYTGVVGIGATDPSGNPLAGDVSWSFATVAVDTTPPTVLSTSPPDGANGVSTTTSVTAIFDEPMDVATITTSTVELRDADNTLVSATAVTYDGGTNTAMLTPSSPLKVSTLYTATVTTGVTDLSGNALATNFSWSFTTADTASLSLWEDATTPSVPVESDANAVELGVKFQSDVDGSITGIRFYKSSANTGTHVGSLWTSDGTLLAQETFTNETPSGWQQVDFGSPLAIQADTVYVASYHTDVGQYSVDAGYFAGSGFDNPPLRALQDGENGGNGVYLYGAGGFPTDTFGSSNYWVDVVFTTD